MEAMDGPGYRADRANPYDSGVSEPPARRRRPDARALAPSARGQVRTPDDSPLPASAAWRPGDPVG